MHPCSISLKPEQLLDAFAQHGLQAQWLGSLKGLEGKLAFSSIQTDSRRVQSDSAWVVFKGEHFDPHTHVQTVVTDPRRAPRLIIFENPEHEEWLKAQRQPSIRVDSARAAWSILWSLACDQPEKDLSFVGITGTNGKTSTTWMIQQLLKSQGLPSLSIGTLGAYFPKHTQSTHHTTPDPDILFPMLQRAKASGIGWVIMEVSSHAVVQQKLRPIRFDHLVWTSFSQDHLDFHKTMEEYWQAKCDFWTGYRKSQAHGWIHSQVTPMPTLDPKNDTTYSVDANSLPEFVMNRFRADHEQQNLLVAKLVCETVSQRALRPSDWHRAQLSVPGRLERLTNRTGPTVFIDYAHTPDALKQSLLALKKHFPQHKLFCLFGCGGDRDKQKRRLMGSISLSIADFTYLTSDNPRNESPSAIMEDIQADFPKSHPTLHGNTVQQTYTCIPDRRLAIKTALEEVGDKDVLLIAGKGHEEYQEFEGNKKLPFSDKNIALFYLAIRNEVMV